MANQRNTEEPITAYMLINGKQVDGPARIEVRNPARPDELVGTIVRGTPDHVDQAVAAAKAAQPGWAKRTFTERADIIAKGLDHIESDVEHRSAVFTRENGKPLAESRGELANVAKRQRLALSYAPELDARRELPAASGRTIVVQRPYGVVVSIVPWNSPVNLAFTQVVAALLAGNSVVLKPPETCPLALIRSVELFAEALPPGTINVVTGMPSEIGDALTTHKDVGKLGFVGSIASARHIMANAAQTIKGVTFELGGNDPALILDDADLGPAAMKSMLTATYQMTGQVCMAIKRVYVPTKRRDEFVDAFTKTVDQLVVGDGLEPTVTMGPLHTEKAKRRAEGLVDDARSRGATVRTLGTINDDSTFARGHFMQPAVVTDIDDDAPLMVEEQFCPVLPVVAYDDLDDAITRANQSIYGLSGSIWSRDVDRAIGLATRMEAGQVWINSHGPQAINHKAPYGGVKQSGIGRKSGIEGILEYVQSQTITTHEA
ncbi:MAG: aldehyde dehydrogenase family protein [Hyphomicrobiaceae bacterium]